MTSLKGTIASIAAGILAGIVFAQCLYGNTGGDPATPPPTMPAPPEHRIVWCTPVAVPLYDNGTDCQ